MKASTFAALCFWIAFASGHLFAQTSTASPALAVDWKTAVSEMPPEAVTESERVLRHQRSAAFDDKTGSKSPLDLSGIERTHEGNDIFYTKIAPLPAFLSDLVAVGTVTGFQAYFSNDRTSIYTELTIYLEKIIKDNAGTRNNEVTVDRLGGAIRISNGSVIRQFTSSPDSDLSVGMRYVLFLAHDAATADFRVIKAWRLNNGRAEPVAKTDMGDVKKGHRSKYVGMSEADFLNAVQLSVSRNAG